MFRAVVLTRQQLCCPSPAALFISSFHSKVGQFSFECCPLFQRSAPGSTTCPVWEVGLLPNAYSQPSLLYPHFLTESLALRVRLLAPSPPLLSVLGYSLLFMFFSFAGVAFSLHWMIFVGDG
jgi:hypothetical protein